MIYIEQKPPTLKYCIFWVTITISLFIMTLFLPSCTISMQNISTHGTSTDLVDEDQAATANPTVSPNISIPAKLL